MRAYRLLAKLPAYVGRFGALSGIKLLLQIERPLPVRAPRGTATSTYDVPGYPAPIRLRHVASDHATFWQCVVAQQYDFERFPQSIRLRETYNDDVGQGKSPLIIDCGANIGLASLWFASKFPHATIYALEPDEENFSLLTANVEHLGGRVVPLRGAVWSEKAKTRIVNPEAGSAAFRVEASRDGEAGVRGYTVDEVCALAGAAAPLIVKLDIEGSQRELFSKNTQWVGHADLIMLELDDWLLPWQGTSRPFFACLSGLPFDYLIGGETIFCFRDGTARPESKF